MKKIATAKEPPTTIINSPQTTPTSLSAENTYRTLKSLITNEISSEQIVYERIFDNSIPQKDRESSFLTEIYNVRKLLKTNSNNDNLMTNREKINTQGSIHPYYQLNSPYDNTLIFESRFETGNLCMAIKVSEWEYDLLMQNDINTGGYTQWFYFRVNNTKARSSVKFNIINFVMLSEL